MVYYWDGIFDQCGKYWTSWLRKIHIHQRSSNNMWSRCAKKEKKNAFFFFIFRLFDSIWPTTTQTPLLHEQTKQFLLFFFDIVIYNCRRQWYRCGNIPFFNSCFYFFFWWNESNVWPAVGTAVLLKKNFHLNSLDQIGLFGW